MREEAVLGLVASVERCGTHPIAAAIVGFIAARSIPGDGHLQSFQELEGQGVAATVEGYNTLIGNAHMLRTQGVACEPKLVEQLSQRWEQQGGFDGLAALLKSSVQAH